MNIKRFGMLVMAVLLLAVLAAGCTQPDNNENTVNPVKEVEKAEIPSEQPEGSEETKAVDTVSEATLSRYDEREIREYKGVRLDPAVGPRDNSIKGIQMVDIEEYTLDVTGLADVPLSMTYDEVLELPAYERLITLYCVEGWDATILWKGVKITDILEAAGIQDTANTVIFKAVDGYTTAMPLSTIKERDMILAYQANGTDLPAAMGYPFIVVAEDKLGYKWARWVNEIELSDDEDFLGFWEQRGYSNTADVSQ